MPGVHISEEGKDQAARLAEVLAARRIDAIFSSPLERTLETAAPLAERLGLKVETSPAFGELRPGEWTGRDFSVLDEDPRWKIYNSFRSGTRPPGGELIAEVQTRFVAEMERLRADYPEATMAVFSHGDPIKSAVAYYAGIPLDLFLRIEIGPACMSTVEVNDWGPRVLGVNTPLA
jgi:probable phosphoglycerate mutase